MSKTELNQTLQSLNPPQLQAVQHDPGVPLQILAGPGSGKTKVLTSRIAHLILNHQISPSSICAVTFTNKAATEMRERLTKLIGKERTSEVRMGTFHALCALYLRKYPQLVGIAPNFTVCDTEESRKIVSPLLKKYKDYLESRNLVLKEGTVLATISRAKAQGFSASAFLEDISAKFLKDSKEGRIHTDNPTHDINQIVAEIYTVYETNLRRNNSLDFDDLLLFGVKLFKYNKIAVRWCKYVLVDEFQDTNITQYELMKALAISSRVTIVGDPDQSIYGWRAAEVGNLGKMKKDFPATEQILLEQNYRSTASILAASLAIISQDKTRIPKKLHTSHPAGPTPVLMCLDGEYGEAAFIADEIKRLVAQTGGMLGWGDFVILLRFNALSRAIESALQKEKIPNRILGGHKFFERCEIKDLLAYLQIIDNPQFAPSFARAVNVPSRGIGEKTLIDIAARAEKVQVSHLALVEKICDGRAPDTKPASKRKLTDFVRIMGTLRKLANEGASPSNLIRKLLDLIGYLDHLKKTEPDWDTRWENVQELITFASDVEGEIKANMHPEGEGNTPLRLFLQASMLSSEGDNQAEGDNKDKVTISTCHSAKGLEWPVVIVPSVEQGTYPFHRSEDIEEERRLLYVACTRAKSLLYLTHVAKRKIAGTVKKRDCSGFVTLPLSENPALFVDDQADFSRRERSVIAKVLDRPEPDEAEVRKQVSEFVSKRPQPEQRVSLKNIRTPFRHYECDDPLSIKLGSSEEDSAASTSKQDHSQLQPTLFASLAAGAQINAAFSRPSLAAVGPPLPPQFAMPVPVLPAMPVNLPEFAIQSKERKRPKPSTLPMRASSALNQPQSSLPAPKPPRQPTSVTRPITRPMVPQPPTIPQYAPMVQPQHVAPPPAPDVPQLAGVKRRLGMVARTTGGYSNKKFKSPT